MVKTTVYLTDIDDFKAMNAVYAEFFPESAPARSTVEVSAFACGSPWSRLRLSLFCLDPRKAVARSAAAPGVPAGGGGGPGRGCPPDSRNRCQSGDVLSSSGPGVLTENHIVA